MTTALESCRLAGWGTRSEKTIIKVGDAEIGGNDLAIIAGPCAVENREQLFTIGESLSRMGVKLFRGGAFKPRTSPYSFQGLGEDGLKMLAEVRDQFGMKIVTEVLATDDVSLVERYTDVLQVGARNMQNFSLLKRVGQAKKPVLLKRGMVATLEEFLLAAEYIMSEGNPDVILCERGIRTFSDHARFTLDLAVIPAIHRLSHLPVIVDPSHGTGTAYKVIPLARAGAAVGADGIIVEVHHQPEHALSDGPQALTPQEFSQLLEEVIYISRYVRNGRGAYANPIPTALAAV